MLRVAAGLPLHSPTDSLRRVGRPTLLELVAVRFVEEVERLQHEGLSGYRKDTERSKRTGRHSAGASLPHTFEPMPHAPTAFTFVAVLARSPRRAPASAPRCDP